MDLAMLIKQLGHELEPLRIKNSIKMLQAETFQLFSEVNELELAGIVKSQSKSDLVYACRLTSEGHFTCCTQNLRPCGGLKGSVCKHILVLLIGLAQADLIPLRRAYTWVRASQGYRHSFDKETVSGLFIRYKGAEAGEIDWRPTETIPEDYYMF